jgi:hypothetical protein
MKNLLLTFITLVLTLTNVSAQNEMSLDEAIHTARMQSVEALQARQSFMLGVQPKQCRNHQRFLHYF